MLLVIDVGNTNIVLGLCDGDKLAHYARIATRIERTGDEYGIIIANLFALKGIKLTDVHAVIIASVVPPVQSALQRAIRRYFAITALVVGPDMKSGLPITDETPQGVGADRLVNAVAAYETVGHAAIVVDFGTATTFDLIGPDGAYLGGAIAPGINASLDALFEKTAKLPRIELGQPEKVVGKNTETAMRSGLYWGYVGLVDGLISRMLEEAAFERITVIATGGLAKLIAKDSQTIDKVDDMLTLQGLRLLYQLNR
uniref:Type III pantothenate kinase n=1 Tax=Magnetococcus massalia (strain MO-1) TaxID=451514 RepID=A0A1S7LKR6_MAGMO|nr:Type III pantothenate kinase. Coenzyme A biosynthetic pathway [Candidatus Magnetococcus massalia]